MFVLYLCGIMVVCENQTKSSNNNLSGALNTNISVFVENTSTEPSGPLGFKTKRPEYKLASWLTFKVLGELWKSLLLHADFQTI